MKLNNNQKIQFLKNQVKAIRTIVESFDYYNFSSKEIGRMYRDNISEKLIKLNNDIESLERQI